MIERFALESYVKELSDEVCRWLIVNGIEPNNVPFYSEIHVADGQISYDEMQRNDHGHRTGVTIRRTAPLVVPMAPELADRWRLLPRLCDRCRTNPEEATR